MVSDLRAVPRWCCGLVASETRILRVYPLDRGYENLEKNSAGWAQHTKGEEMRAFSQCFVHCLMEISPFHGGNDENQAEWFSNGEDPCGDKREKVN